MRRILSLFICAMMLFTCISCTAETPEIVPEYDSSIPEDGVDLNGQTIIMGIRPMSYYESDNSTLTYTNDTELGDLAAQRVRDVQNKYNCKIEFNYVTGPGAIAYNSAIAGTYVFDFLLDESYFLENYMRAIAFVDLTTVENLDVFDETKWGNRYMRLQTMYNGAIYSVLPAAHPMRSQLSMGDIIVINEDYIATLNTTDPRDYFENGEWTWETFTKCLNTYAHTNGISNDYIYAFSSGFGGFARCIAMSNGVDYITLNDSGKIEQLGYLSQQAIDAYTQCFEWFYGATADNVLSEGSGQDRVDGFVNGNSVMLATGIQSLLSKTDSIVYKMENYGIVPPPTGPNAENPKDYKLNLQGAMFALCIPITAKDPEVSALILDKLYEPFEGYETKEQLIDYLSKNYFLDTRDSSIFLELVEENHVWFHPSRHGGFSGMTDQMPSTGVVPGVEANSESLLTNAEKDFLPMYNTLIQYEELFHE